MRQHDLSLWTIPSSGKKPTSLQIEEFMIAVIKSRAVKPRECIPSHRTLAKLNQVNRNTALRAYTKLIASGWLVHNHGGKATVAQILPGELATRLHSLPSENMPIPLAIPAETKTNAERSRTLGFIEIGLSLIEFQVSRGSRKKNISTIANEKIAPDNRSNSLNKEIFSHLLLRGFRIHRENFCLIRGRAECLSGIFKTVNCEQCCIVNTSPSDILISSLLQQCNIRSIELETSSENILKQLGTILCRTKIRAIYIRPSSTYPTCQAMDEASLLALIELAKTHGFFIIEENDDHELWWGRTPTKPMYQYPHHGHLIYCAPLSRASPYMQHLLTVIAPAKFIAHIDAMSEVHLGYRDPTEEKKISEMIRENQLTAISRNIRLLKQKHLKTLDEILRLQLGNHIDYELPKSGTAIWISFAKSIDLLSIIEALKTEGYQLRSSHYRSRPGHRIHKMRLDFSRFSETQCRKVAIRLRNILSARAKTLE